LAKAYRYKKKQNQLNLLLKYFYLISTALLIAGSTLPFWIPLFASTSSYCKCRSKALGCSYNCRQLTYGSFQLTHMSRDYHTVQLIEPWLPKRRQNIITVLTTLPQGWVLGCKHQCLRAITTMWTESLWAFLESYVHCRWQLDRALKQWWSMGRQKHSELHHWVSFCKIIIRLCHGTTAIMTV